MALETLRGVTEIGGFKVGRGNDVLCSKCACNDRPDCCGIDLIPDYINKFIVVDDETNRIIFKIQDGPIKEHGVNGCQAITILEAMRIMYLEHNKKIPCTQNDTTIHHLDLAIQAQNERTANRENRGVEGTSKA